LPAALACARVTAAALPAGPDGPRLTRTPRGLELHYPPLRQPGTALLLFLFGALAIAIPAIGLAVLWPQGRPDAASVVGLVLFGTFAVPFLFFGALFTLLALGLAAGSLTVDVTARGLVATRRLFGIVTSRRELAREDIAALDAEPTARYQRTGSARPVFRLVARSRAAGRIDDHRNRRVIAGDSLKGEDTVAAVRAVMLEHLDLRDLPHGG
jgi:hypothetical protein